MSAPFARQGRCARTQRRGRKESVVAFGSVANPGMQREATVTWRRCTDLRINRFAHIVELRRDGVPTRCRERSPEGALRGRDDSEPIAELRILSSEYAEDARGRPLAIDEHHRDRDSGIGGGVADRILERRAVRVIDLAEDVDDREFADESGDDERRRLSSHTHLAGAPRRQAACATRWAHQPARSSGISRLGSARPDEPQAAAIASW